MENKIDFYKNGIIELLKVKNLPFDSIRTHFTEKEGDDFSFTDFVKSVNILEDETAIYKIKNKYHLVDGKYLAIGVIDIKQSGFGFITNKNYEKDIFISRDLTKNAFKFDKVLYLIDYKLEGEVLEILDHTIKDVVGEVTSSGKKLFCYDKKNKINLLVRSGSCKVGDICKCKITNYNPKGYNGIVEGVIVEVLGNINDLGSDVMQIALNYNIPLKFSDDVLNEAKSLSKEINYDNRIDYTNDFIITIDGDDAKDLDDAISVKQLKNGNFLLGVYIADVSYYVSESSYLDKEALNRGCSVYLTDRVIPMLPFELSNDLCSLNEQEEKYVISCIMEINEYGEVINSSINQGIIKSSHRMTYNNCNKMLEDNDVEVISKYPKVYNMLLDCLKLQNILFKMRIKRGSLDFDIDEAKIICDNEGKCIDVVLRSRGIAERIIEEFMLIANETVAQTIYNIDLPFVYRVHDKVDKEKLTELQTLFKLKGYHLPNNNNIYPKQMQKVLDNVDEADSYLKRLLLRLMAKAVYSIENIGHFGLASSCYTHFTSPIRRYPDLIVHRLLRKYLFNHDINANEFDSLTLKLDDICLKSSENERNSMKCEWDVEDMKKAEYMSKYIGKVFDGTITSVTNFGMFIELDNTIEGLVRYQNMDDYYEYIPSLRLVVGQMSKKVHRLGDKVRIKVINSSKETSEIDFKLEYNYSMKKEKKYGKNSRKK